MITKSQLINLLEKKSYSNFEIEDIFEDLNLYVKESGIFAELVFSLEKEGFLYRNEDNRLEVSSKSKHNVGIYLANKLGYGFVRQLGVSDKTKDTYVGFRDSNGAMNGDRVLYKMKKKKKNEKESAAIISVVERSNYNIIGEFHRYKNNCYLIPDEQNITVDVYIDADKTLGANSGQKVVVKVTKWPNKSRILKAEVIEILGYPDEYGVDILSIIRRFNLPDKFSSKVMETLNTIPNEVQESDLNSRVDHRNDLVITIDGEDAKDLDDAVSLKYLSNLHYKLDVHIADVSHYVKENSKIDAEALKRGTSVYLVDKVIPMLPKELSNGICSLNPNVDRLTMTCSMELDEKGNLIDYSIYKSVICSKYRMTYTDVSDILEGIQDERLEKYEILIPMLKLMRELTEILRLKREARGSIDFNFKESYIITNADGKAIDVKERHRRIANRIIEEFMLSANECVALHAFKHNLPFVYRVHKKPELEKIMAFRRFIFNLGYKLEGSEDNVEPKYIQSILKKIEGIKEEKVINKLLLRSLQKAKYSNVLDSHFGLACDYYCHFTSPIRRYPDLQIHRILSESVAGNLNSSRLEQLKTKVAISSELSSEREVVADEAQRDSEKMKKAEYMSQFIGSKYNAVISSIVPFGFYVELDNTVEGLVHISKLNGYFTYDEDKLMLIAPNKEYSIGDNVEVILVGVDVEMREIDFDLYEDYIEQVEDEEQDDYSKSEFERYKEIMASINKTKIPDKKKKVIAEILKEEKVFKKSKKRTKERWKKDRKKSKKSKKNKNKKSKKNKKYEE